MSRAQQRTPDRHPGSATLPPAYSAPATPEESNNPARLGADACAECAGAAGRGPSSAAKPPPSRPDSPRPTRAAARALRLAQLRVWADAPGTLPALADRSEEIGTGDKKGPGQWDPAAASHSTDNKSRTNDSWTMLPRRPSLWAVAPQRRAEASAAVYPGLPDKDAYMHNLSRDHSLVAHHHNRALAAAHGLTRSASACQTRYKRSPSVALIGHKRNAEAAAAAKPTGPKTPLAGSPAGGTRPPPARGPRNPLNRSFDNLEDGLFATRVVEVPASPVLQNRCAASHAAEDGHSEHDDTLLCGPQDHSNRPSLALPPAPLHRTLSPSDAQSLSDGLARHSEISPRRSLTSVA